MLYSNLIPLSKIASVLILTAAITACSSISTLEAPEVAIVTNSADIEIVSVAEDYVHILSNGGKSCTMSSSGEMIGATSKISAEGDSLESGITGSQLNLGNSTYLASEILYRACELSVNYGLNKGEAVTLFLKGLEAVADITGSAVTTLTTATSDSDGSQ